MDPAAPISDALILGAALALAVGLIGYLRRWLTGPAAVLAVIVGAIIFTTGKTLTLALLFFFFSTRLLERSARSLREAEDLSAQHDTARTIGQVAAVGTVPALAGALQLVWGDTAFAAAALGAIAFATADSWATAVGMTSRALPRLLGFGRQVPAGFSGGMTARGTVASVLGAVSVGLIAIGLSGPGAYRPLLWITGLGIAGALFDSLLGAFVQRRYRCAACNLPTENASHCGQPADRVGGLLSNAGVNLVCSLAVAIAAWMANK